MNRVFILELNCDQYFQVQSATEVEVEYVEAPLEIAEEDEDNPIFADFKAIFEKFQLAQEGEVEGEGAGEEDKATKDENATTKDDGDDSDDSEDDKEGDDDDEVCS